MRVHVSSCLKVQEQMANCPKFVPVVPTSQPIPRWAACWGRREPLAPLLSVSEQVGGAQGAR